VTTARGGLGYLVGKVLTVSGMVLIGMVLQLTPGLFLLEGLTVTSVGGWLTFAWVVLLGGEVARFFRDAFPQLPPVRAVAGWTGTITYTPDGRPLIGPVPGAPGVWLLTGFGGHGLPPAAYASRLAVRAALAIEPMPPAAAGRYALGRFPGFDGR
jgi:hypothetical protein